MSARKEQIIKAADEIEEKWFHLLGKHLAIGPLIDAMEWADSHPAEHGFTSRLIDLKDREIALLTSDLEISQKKLKYFENLKLTMCPSCAFANALMIKKP